MCVLCIFRYTDFRLPPSSPEKYTLSSMFYIILACRLGFVVIFEVSSAGYTSKYSQGLPHLILFASMETKAWSILYGI